MALPLSPPAAIALKAPSASRALHNVFRAQPENFKITEAPLAARSVEPVLSTLARALNPSMPVVFALLELRAVRAKQSARRVARALSRTRLECRSVVAAPVAPSASVRALLLSISAQSVRKVHLAPLTACLAAAARVVSTNQTRALGFAFGARRARLFRRQGRTLSLTASLAPKAHFPAPVPIAAIYVPLGSIKTKQALTVVSSAPKAPSTRKRAPLPSPCAFHAP